MSLVFHLSIIWQEPRGILFGKIKIEPRVSQTLYVTYVYNPVKWLLLLNSSIGQTKRSNYLLVLWIWKCYLFAGQDKHKTSPPKVWTSQPSTSILLCPRDTIILYWVWADWDCTIHGWLWQAIDQHYYLTGLLAKWMWYGANQANSYSSDGTVLLINIKAETESSCFS